MRAAGAFSDIVVLMGGHNGVFWWMKGVVGTMHWAHCGRQLRPACLKPGTASFRAHSGWRSGDLHAANTCL